LAHHQTAELARHTPGTDRQRQGINGGHPCCIAAVRATPCLQSPLSRLSLQHHHTMGPGNLWCGRPAWG
jgi:hypothetical protein